MNKGFISPLFWVLVFPMTLTAQPSFILNGSAEILSENCYKLSSAKTANDVGSMCCEFPIQLNHAFEMRFAINLGCGDYSGEGIAFVLHNSKDKYNAIGCAGSAMGFGIGNDCSTPITPSIAVEFDSRYSKGQADLYAPHISIVEDGNQSLPLTKPVKMSIGHEDVRDCEYHQVKISWNPSKQTMEIYFDEILRTSYKGNLQQFFGKEKNIYVGFTASSGTKANLQMICIQSLDVQLDEAFDSQLDFEESVGIFPNPFRERLTVDLSFSKEEKINIQLFDGSGKVVQEIPNHYVKNNQYYFNMPGLPSGIYYITVTNGQHRVSKKFFHNSSIRA
jgi:hypothetical protein